MFIHSGMSAPDLRPSHAPAQISPIQPLEGTNNDSNQDDTKPGQHDDIGLCQNKRDDGCLPKVIFLSEIFFEQLVLLAVPIFLLVSLTSCSCGCGCKH